MMVNSWTACLQVSSLFQDINGAQPRPTEQSQGLLPDIRNDTQSGPISALSTHQKHDFTNAELKINHLISICWWLPQKKVKTQIPSRLSGEEMTPATQYVENSLTVITGTEGMKFLKQAQQGYKRESNCWVTTGRQTYFANDNCSFFLQHTKGEETAIILIFLHTVLIPIKNVFFIHLLISPKQTSWLPLHLYTFVHSSLTFSFWHLQYGSSPVWLTSLLEYSSFDFPPFLTAPLKDSSSSTCSSCFSSPPLLLRNILHAGLPLFSLWLGGAICLFFL